MGTMRSGDEFKKPGDSDEGTANLEKLLGELPANIQNSVMAGVTQALSQNRQQTQADAQAQQQAAPQTQQQEAPLIPEDTDFEKMDNADMVALLVGVIDKKLGGLTDALEPKFADMSNRLTTKDLKDQVKEVAATNPNFWAYREIMGGLAKQYPDLSPTDLFELAQAKSPEIAQGIAEKKATEEAEANKGKAIPFGGLTPTSGHSLQDTEGMSFKDASDKAWEEIMGDLPPEIIGGSNN